MTTTEFNFKVFFVFFGIRRVDLDIFHRLLAVEEIVGHWFRQSKWIAHVLEELAGEFVAVNYSENLTVEFFENLKINKSATRS
jgi:hypothetical protein